jgi:Zn-dependent peptidase ImmA (M78 family)
MKEILDENKIKLYYKSLKNIEEGKNVSWAIFQIDDGYAIMIEESESENRKRFTLAHELWHFFLHKEILDNGIIDYSYTLYRSILYSDLDSDTKKIEEEANYFASELLMPENLVREAWTKTKNIEELSFWFKVSMQAMSFRLINLWLMDW